ncbi:DinB family protein [bacterium]|nr:DinB family protein [bacterium]
MYRSIADFKKFWSMETEKTRKLFDAFTDQSLSQSVSDGHRTIGRIAWHIVTTIPEMCSRTGLTFKSVDMHAPVPTSAKEIASTYQAAADELLAQVTSKWTDDTLHTKDEMYGEQWPKGETLLVLQVHQTHHRGQLTVLMRQAGLKVPGPYGPSKEEWAAYGAPAPEI